MVQGREFTYSCPEVSQGLFLDIEPPHKYTVGSVTECMPFSCTEIDFATYSSTEPPKKVLGGIWVRFVLELVMGVLHRVELWLYMTMHVNFEV